jgi:hypothetical protein
MMDVAHPWCMGEPMAVKKIAHPSVEERRRGKEARTGGCKPPRESEERALDKPCISEHEGRTRW